MPNANKPKPLSKFFRVAVEGATCDGRVIEKEWIEQMAESYDPSVYTARVNLEHLRGLFPDGPFQRYGDVKSLKAEVIKDDNALKGKLALYAQIEPTEELVQLTKKKQKIFTSIEIHPSFADSGKAYLRGLAITDDPASLGTEMLQFAATAKLNPLNSRKQSPEHYFSEAHETVIELEMKSDEGVLSKVKAMLFRQKKETDDNHSDVTAAVLELTEFCNTLKDDNDKLRSEVNELNQKILSFEQSFSSVPATEVSSRMPATGQDVTEFKTDC